LKKLLLILLFLSPVFSEAQTSVYHPFPEDSAKWCAKWCDGGIWMGSSATWQLNGKVLIDGNWYSRLLHYETLGYLAGFCIPSSTFFDSTTFYIRQDTVLKKVWMYWPPSHSDTLFLDFDLAIGDTLHFINENQTYIVISIDSMLVNNQYRLRYNYQSTINQGCVVSMVEGIGPMYGLTYAPNNNNCFERFAFLNYFEQNSQLVYVDSSAAGMPIFCHDFTLQIEELNQTSFSISPNPAHDKLNVECNLQNAELKIYDMMGREVYSATLNTKHQTLNLRLSPAMYFVRVGNHTQKLVVE
jgi:hypothetical protein